MERPSESYRFEAGGFLALPEECTHFERAAVAVLPVPYEWSTSYRGGTRHGPAAILEASAQIELYDPELDDEPALRWGIHTLPPLARELRSPEAAVETVAAAVADLAAAGKLPVVLGGEHGISIGVARGLARVFRDFVTVQLDAHADLREEYEGSPLSHACAARRIAEVSPIVQLGLRSLDASEARFLREQPERVCALSAEEWLRDPAAAARWVADRVRGRRVYLTLDVDVLDPSLMPATGTPEPGGPGWRELLPVLRAVAEAGEIVAFDCVELAPIPGMHAPDYTAARLVDRVIREAMRRRPHPARAADPPSD